MAETTPDLRGLPKAQAYDALREAIFAVLSGVDDPIAGMATMSALIHHGFGHLWTGFYRVVRPDLLRVGPYQGTLGCLEIPFGKGVCGTCAAERCTVLVPDVHVFPGHITCDARSRSEIVVPVFDARDVLLSVLDIDSDKPSAFDEEDKARLEDIVTWFKGLPCG